MYGQVRRKRRLVARVRCRNIKTECPKVTCAAPVILPGACCKTCPLDTQDDQHHLVFSHPDMPGKECMHFSFRLYYHYYYYYFAVVKVKVRKVLVYGSQSNQTYLEAFDEIYAGLIAHLTRSKQKELE